MRAASDALERLAHFVDQVRGTPPARFEIPWPWWQRQLPGTIGEPAMTELEAAYPEGISRDDLRSMADGAATGDTERLLRLFVATMMWGVGRGDGRGPWRTATGLRSEGALDSIVETAALVRAGAAAEAFDRLARGPGRLERIGQSFFTKWLWIAGAGAGLAPQPLILDYRVSASLRSLQWRAERRGAALRYTAYLDQASQWAGALGVASETIEQALFKAAGNL
jgi:hypothetical protein